MRLVHRLLALDAGLISPHFFFWQTDWQIFAVPAFGEKLIFHYISFV
jgi:hypothetical protein